jgi:hypothetical protein
MCWRLEVVLVVVLVGMVSPGRKRVGKTRGGGATR